jgi:cephalosporin-C deacetylase-like acetyl esterase
MPVDRFASSSSEALPMADPVRPDAQTFDHFIRQRGAILRHGDAPPATRKEWEERRGKLRQAMFAAMGPFPERACPLEPKEVGVLKRHGYRIEKLLFQSRPDVGVTASLYVPEPLSGKAPAVLVVHGHWAGARRDPVVQARCLGLVKLGFVVLAVDAFGAGERHPTTARGPYHGALFGASLWPAGQSLLGVQVDDNRRAVDYLISRPEVDGARLGVTGASGGGNQTMYAGALDERFGAVVPVCSVGNYQAYLQAACCVCEVLPSALRFTEEGDVLGLVAPRALMVVNATRDSFQFSVGEAEKSLARAKAIFKLYDAEERLRHAVFESPHAYNQAMREAMYGWMTRWLKNEGDGKPIPEPKHDIDTPEDLSCLPEGRRPAAFLFPPGLAGREAKRLLEPFAKGPPDHKEMWEGQAVVLRGRLRDEVFGGFPKVPRQSAALKDEGLILQAEEDLTLAARLRRGKDDSRACLLLHLDGADAALKQPLAEALKGDGWTVLAPDLRATGAAGPKGDAVRDAPDHNSAEHAVWIGRPLLGQWTFDVVRLLDWLESLPQGRERLLAVAGVGGAGLVALCAGALDGRIAAVAALDAPVSLVTATGYAPGTRMGLLAPGLLRVGDVPQLAALAAPRSLLVAGGVRAEGQQVEEKPLVEAFAFTQAVYRLAGAGGRLRVKAEMKAKDVAGWLQRT